MPATTEQRKTVDITPAWGGAMEIFIALLEGGTPKGKEEARAELRDLARKLDATGPARTNDAEFDEGGAA